MNSNRTRHHRFLVLVAPPLALLAWALPPAEPHGDATPPFQCVAILNPDTARIQPEAVVVGYTVPDSIGTVTEVTAEEGSGIVVGTLDSESRTVALGTESAMAGRWSLTFAGDSSRFCGGIINVIGIQSS